ncbi:MAG: glycoside hydrolase family 3 C-terminal domain-containing protein [Oscillospiraceae bacterium]|nr:glycoside hydrolase family 3 C-terminal domain-containing protein [Oscillospiraceae bacterium]
MPQFARFLYHPIKPLGPKNTPIIGCKAHWKLSKEAAIEGTVLLKNDGTLPLAKGSKVCLFGRGAGRYLDRYAPFMVTEHASFLFGGGGSGRVHTDTYVTLGDALEASADLEVFTPVIDFYTEAARREVDEALTWDTLRLTLWNTGHNQTLPVLPEELYQQAKAFGDTAIFCLPRFSTEHTFYGDRSGGAGDFTLLPEEKELLDRLTQDFSKVIVILNVTGPVSTKEYKENDRIGAVLYPMFGGGLAGEALTDILLGNAYPSGHLQDTLAETIEDYPSTVTIRESQDYVNYTEDIFVGYRYFETFAPEKVVYPYGFGLSYTTFAVEKEAARLEKNTASVDVRVTNTGDFKGKEVVQLYLTAPQGKLGKAKKVLCAFGKTRELAPGESQTLKLRFDIREFGSFDDLGKVAKSCFVLEKGEYTVSMGVNVRDTAPALTFTLDADIICRRCHSYMAPTQLPHRLTADGTLEALPVPTPVKHPIRRYKLTAQAPDPLISLGEALDTGRLDEFMASLTDEQLCDLLHGHPKHHVANTCSIGTNTNLRQLKHKIPLIPTCDGPAGVRATLESETYTTFFPCANTVSQSWNPALARRIGAAGALEAKELNAGIWLTPALNIHRSPLCGRNFEYFSEDPLISGIFAAAAVTGIQSQGIAATIKHFCCNNKEGNRKQSDSRVSERALREIYLRGFEIAVKKSHPWSLMTAYNKVNGVRTSANWELLNGILRSEWKYDGLVMTDWDLYSQVPEEVHAGSDVKMPKILPMDMPNKPAPYQLTDKMAAGELDRGAVLLAVRRILSFMSHFE